MKSIESPAWEEIMDKAKAAFMGDALGATTEFMTSREIKVKFGVHNQIIGKGWLYLKPGQVTDGSDEYHCTSHIFLHLSYSAGRNL